MVGKSRGGGARGGDGGEEAQPRVRLPPRRPGGWVWGICLPLVNSRGVGRLS